MKLQKNVLLRTASILLITAIIFPALAFAAKSSCKDCDKLNSLTEKASKLSPQKEEDRIKGLDLILEAQPLLIKLDESKDKTKMSEELFKSVVSFAREAVLFDDESQLAGFLGEWTQSNEKLKKQFDAISKNFSSKPALNSCKNQRLLAGVEEVACLTKAKIGPEDKGINSADRASEKCMRPFDLEACLKKAK